MDRYIKDVLPTKPIQSAAQRPQLERWKAEIGSYALAEITPALIVECRDRLLTEPTPRAEQRIPATVVRYMSVLSHAFTIAVNEWQWLVDSPMRKVKNPKESKGRVRWLDDGERAQLLQACKQSPNPLLFPCVVLALSSGMRQG
ncbi:MAG: hypothetical protein PHD43_04530 [Methylococcales bacterium]|nr:hypothetical protein [Methylococcales bacterium]